MGQTRKERAITGTIPPKNHPHRGRYNFYVQKERVEREMEQYVKEGYRCISIIGVRPDIIAIKDGKVIGIEVEYGNPRPNKYLKETAEQYDEIVWLLRRSQKKNAKAS